MASSRLEKIGTIFSRVTGLRRSGALKEEDTPLWYAVYKAFPPQYEPNFDRPAPNITIQPIFYAEDNLRAKFHKQAKFLGTINLNDHNTQTTTQKFITIYNQLKEEGRVSEENVFDSALDAVKAQTERQSPAEIDNYENPKGKNESLASLFREAQSAQQQRREDQSSLKLNIKDIFKE